MTSIEYTKNKRAEGMKLWLEFKQSKTKTEKQLIDVLKKVFVFGLTWDCEYQKQMSFIIEDISLTLPECETKLRLYLIKTISQSFIEYSQKYQLEKTPGLSIDTEIDDSFVIEVISEYKKLNDLISADNEYEKNVYESFMGPVFGKN